MSAEQEADIIERLTENPFLTAVGFAREFGVGANAISAIIRRHGLKCQIAAHRLRLNEEHRINRIAFCQTVLEQWDEDKLQSNVFSDEKCFCTDVSWRANVYRPENSRHDPKYMQVVDQSGRITNNYWGAIGYDGPVTPLVRIDGRFNSNGYMRLLRTHVVPMMNRFEDDGSPRIFMQDNSPIHKSAAVMAFFSRQRFELLDWPAKSPDLNPIENVWSRMEVGWPQIYPRTAENLHAVVQERWDAQSPGRKFILKKLHKIVHNF